MALSREHTSAKAADVAKLLLLNKRQETHPLTRGMVVTPPNHNPNYSLTLTLCDPYYHKHLMFSSMAHLSTEICENWLNGFCVILLTNAQTNANQQSVGYLEK